MKRRRCVELFVALVVVCACAPTPPTTDSSASTEQATSPSPAPSRIVHRSQGPVVTGAPIDLADLSGRIVTDDFEDVFAFDVDGSNFTWIARDPAGSEFDGSWSPDGSNLRRIEADAWIDYPSWSPDGTRLAFNGAIGSTTRSSRSSWRAML